MRVRKFRTKASQDRIGYVRMGGSVQVRGYIGTSTSTSGSGSGNADANARRGKGRDRTRETSHPDPGSVRNGHSHAVSRLYAGQLEADSLNNADSYQHNTIRIPDDHPGEATPLALNRVVSWDVLGIHSFIHSLYLSLYGMYASRYTANSLAQTPKVLELE